MSFSGLFSVHKYIQPVTVNDSLG